MGIGGADGVVAKVINDEPGAVYRELDIKLAEEGHEGRWRRSAGAEGKENVAIGVEELEEDLRREVRTETCSAVFSMKSSSREP